MRSYIRHPSNIPIEVRSDPKDSRNTTQLRDISHGGLCYVSTDERHAGEIVRIRVPLVSQDFEIRARVAWCRKRSDGYLIGVQFLRDEDAFRTRMVEQMCHIEDYRRAVLRNEGRRLSAQEAALEWIEKHAAALPNPLAISA